MRYLQWLLVAAYLLCASMASGQVWYTAFNNGGTALPVGAELVPPVPMQSQFPSFAHFMVTDAETDDSNTLNVSKCMEVIVTVYNSSWVTDDGDFYVMKSPDAAKTLSFKVLADFNGDGVIDASDEVTLDGDDGTDQDGDLTERQTGTLYGITGANFIWMDTVTAPGSGTAHVEVSCR